MSTVVTSGEPTRTVPPVEEGFDVFDILIVLARYWKLFVVLAVLGALAGTVIAMRLKPRYEAHATFLLDQPQSAGSSLGVVFLASQGDQTLALLGSNSLVDLTLKHLDLQSYHDPKTPSNPRDQRNFVMSKAAYFKAPTGIYIISVRDEIPARAMAIANAYLQGLEDMHDRMNIEAAQRTKEFFRRQMAAESVTLQQAEEKLKAAQEKTGLLQPAAQTSMSLSEIEGLRNTLRSLQIQRGTSLQTMTPDSAEVQRINRQITETQKQLAALEAKIKVPSNTNIPAQNFEVAQLQGSLSAAQDTLSSFSTQYERARLQEAYTLPEVKVVDTAELPMSRTWPNPPEIVIFASIAGLVFALFIVGILEFWHWLQRQPESMAKVRIMRQNLGLRSS